jgi:3-isopropylmalate dehydrogenase
MKARIALTPGDGIGPEVVNEARLVLEAIAQRGGHEFKFSEHLLGGCAIDAKGTAMPDETLAAARAADAVLLGAVGGPKWDDPQAKVRPEQGLLAIRKGLGLYANVRPVCPYPSLARLSPLKPERVAGVDFVVIRELTGGLYFGTPKGRTVRRRRARRRRYAGLHREGDPAHRDAGLPDGAEAAASSSPRSTRPTCSSRRGCGARSPPRSAAVPGRALEHQLVDSCAMRLVTHAPPSTSSSPKTCSATS